jgi:hypothetical protein
MMIEELSAVCQLLAAAKEVVEYEEASMTFFG